MNNKQMLSELENLIRINENKKKSQFIARYVGAVNHEKRKKDEQSRLIFHGLSVPEVKELNEKFNNKYLKSGLNPFIFWQFTLENSKVYEAHVCAAHFLRKCTTSDLKKNSKVWTWVQYVDNWHISDELSSVYATLLESDFEKYRKTYEKWNSSINPWLRRQSVVGILNYARFRKKSPPHAWVLSQIDSVLRDSHFYVQRGVGWAIRECYNMHPDVTLNYIEKNVKVIPPAGWYAATEKLKPKDKQKIVLLRKNPNRDSVFL